MQKVIELHGIEYEYAKALISAMIAGFTIAPFMIFIAKSVALSMGQKKTVSQALFEGIKSFIKPIQVFSSLEYRCFLLVYILTFAMSNTSHLLFESVEFINTSMAKLLASFIVRTTGTMVTDKIVIQKVSKNTPKPLPFPSIVLFFIRDILAMAAAFTIPPLLASELQQFIRMRYQAILSIAHILSPMLIQFITTLVHLLAVDLYNREGVSFAGRMDQVKKRYWSCLVLRMVGFTAAYGIASNVNLEVQRLMHQLFAGY